ncbi:MAG TPA: class I SAM-dependent methyltransferase [Elainellaceae cyanobacterium]
MSATFTKLAYQTFQQSKSYFGLAHKTLSSQLLNFIAPSPEDSKTKPLSPNVLVMLQERLSQLIDTDWRDAERGVYPPELLFDNPWEDFFRYYPMLWVDMPQIWDRANQKRHREFSSGIKTEGYPRYYLQNFHHQTDGYLSDMSANLYDLQVEILFNGSADAMRRRVLSPLKTALNDSGMLDAPQTRILDVACGTGRTLKFLQSAIPNASLYGVDLSSAYLRKANELLSQQTGALPQLLQANAEELPYRDGYFHAITCVFLFHELPAPVRQRIIDQCFRGLQPGGVFVICDSIQRAESPEFEPLMENFPAMFHEPFYRNYTEDNLSDRLRHAGFETIDTQIHFMSKYWVARKPMSLSSDVSA